MSAVAVVVQALLADSGVQVIVGNKVEPLVIGQTVAPPYIVVQLVSEDSEEHLAGPSGVYIARVSVECTGKANDAPQVMRLGEAVKAALGGITRQTFAGCVTTIWKAESDVSNFADERSLPGRTLDFYVRWHRA